VPAGAGIRALDEDGTLCSADYYLRITTDAGKILKGQIPLTSVRPTQPTTATAPPPQPTGDLAAGRAVSASSVNGPYAAADAVDASTGSYWESSGAFPQWLQADLVPAGRVVLRRPPRPSRTDGDHARSVSMVARSGDPGVVTTDAR
jgi:hypothetical protein